MKERTTKRIRNKRIKNQCFNIELEDFDTLQFRRPYPAAVSEVMALYTDTAEIYKILKKVMAKNNEKPTDESIQEQILKEQSKEEKTQVEIASQNTKLMNISGAAIGLSWYHDEYDLEANLEMFNGNYEKYGEAVCRELYDFGVDMSIFSELSKAIMTELHMSNMSKEVRDRVNFSKAQKDLQTS